MNWESQITPDELTELISEIENSKKLPNRFYELYDKAYMKKKSKDLI